MALVILGGLIRAAAGLYLLVMLVRMVIDWVRILSPQWRPSGVILVVANVVYALTDPPLRALRRRIPPLRLGGGIALDVGFMVLFLAVIVVQWLGGLLQVMGQTG
ncbi:YggT family protein [Schaalia naturae]|jgi:YggT family protein|uniref:YggT family protein n=1 Tax=Schaalia naturae TaxID=635203 RepID=A0ABW2SN81_9ACTO